MLAGFSSFRDSCWVCGSSFKDIKQGCYKSVLRAEIFRTCLYIVLDWVPMRLDFILQGKDMMFIHSLSTGICALLSANDFLVEAEHEKRSRGSSRASRDATQDTWGGLSLCWDVEGGCYHFVLWNISLLNVSSS